MSALQPTAPAVWSTDPAWAAWERQHLFPATWQCAARLEELAEPGSAVPVELPSGPVVLTRDTSGLLHAFANVCRHRAGPVCTEAAVRSRLVCGYHGWSYGLEGRLVHVPELPLASVPAECKALPAYPCDLWGPWVFVRQTADGVSLADWLGEIVAETAPFRLEALQFVRRMTYEIACNWKVYIENFLEPYHLPVVHPALHRMTDYDAYRVEVRRWHSRQFGPPRARAESPVDLSPAGAPEPGASWYWLFPNFIVNCSFGLMSMNQVLPLGGNRCRLVCDFFVDPSSPPEHWEPSIAFSHQVQEEDLAICEAVQRGLESGSYTQGVLHPSRETGVAHFVALLRESGMG